MEETPHEAAGRNARESRHMTKTSVLVLGAGMVGTCTALHLALRGQHVTLVDRREPGRETSYGNAGIIQREAVQPYAFPQEWPALANVALKRGAAVNYHLGALPALAHPLRLYWTNSRPARHAEISRSYARLIELECRLLEKEWTGESGLFARMRLR